MNLVLSVSLACQDFQSICRYEYLAGNDFRKNLLCFTEEALS